MQHAVVVSDASVSAVQMQTGMVVNASVQTAAGDLISASTSQSAASGTTSPSQTSDGLVAQATTIVTDPAAVTTATLEGTAKAAQKLAPAYEESAESYFSAAQRAYNQSMDLTSDIFFDPENDDVALWIAQKNMAVSAFNYNMAMASKAQFWLSSSQLAQIADPLGTALEGLGAVVDVATAAPGQQAETAFVDVAGIWGGRIGMTMGGGVAIAEAGTLGEAGGLGFYMAAGTIARLSMFNLAGTIAFRVGAAAIYDLGEDTYQWAQSLTN